MIGGTIDVEKTRIEYNVANALPLYLVLCSPLRRGHCGHPINLRQRF